MFSLNTAKHPKPKNALGGLSQIYEDGQLGMRRGKSHDRPRLSYRWCEDVASEGYDQRGR
jgi:hypothetical protein